MSTDAPTTPASTPEHGPRPRRRLHPLALGLLSTAVSLVAAVGAAALYVAVTDTAPEPPPGFESEYDIRFSAADAEGAEGEAAAPAIDAETLPDLSFPLLDAEGGMASFGDYRGHPLVVNVWASTCAPCLDEMPALQQVSEEHGHHLQFVGLALRDDADDARAMVEQTGVEYDIGMDPDGEITAEIGAVGLPATLFVDARGRVVDAKTGKMSLDEIRTRVEALLG